MAETLTAQFGSVSVSRGCSTAITRATLHERAGCVRGLAPLQLSEWKLSAPGHAVRCGISTKDHKRFHTLRKRLVGGIRGWLGGSRLSWTGQGFGPATL